MNNNLFEVAVRDKYRYPYKGVITTEDLFDLSVTELDKIYRSLNAEKKKANEDSLLNIKDKTETKIDNQIEIIKYIVDVKLAEIEKRKNEKADKERKAKLLGIIEEKENDLLRNMSLEELKKLL